MIRETSYQKYTRKSSPSSLKLSHWRHISLVESTVLGLLLGAAGIIALLPAPFLIRLGLVAGLLATGGTLALQLHTQLQEREWRHFRRPTVAYFLGYGLTRLLWRPANQTANHTIKYRERTKQLFLTLQLGDQTLLALVDDLSAAPNEPERRRSYDSLMVRAGFLLTYRENRYLAFWRALTDVLSPKIEEIRAAVLEEVALAMLQTDVRIPTRPTTPEQHGEPEAAFLATGVFLKNEANPYIPSDIPLAFEGSRPSVLASTLEGILNVGALSGLTKRSPPDVVAASLERVVAPDAIQALMSGYLTLVETKLDEIWDRIVSRDQ